MQGVEKGEKKIKEDVWIPSSCSMCYNGCGIMAHRVDDVVIKIEGNPDSPIGGAKLCPKGISSLLMPLYDPNRVNVPLKRTNPEKGLGIDPKWKEITWEEALETIADKLKNIWEDDPRKLLFQGSTTIAHSMLFALRFLSAFGSPNFVAGGGGLHCGNGAHLIGGIMHASWSLVPDFQYCNYALYFGASKGHSAGHGFNVNAQLAADARVRGMKLVVVDPMCGSAAAKAAEWVPIRVGTDAALALAMVNLMLNKYNIYDASYLKSFTNAPYLIEPEGYYLRERETNKPMVWDASDKTAKAYDAPDIKDLALEGEYTVYETRATPSFQLLKEHVKKYTPEEASRITSIPPETIERLAKEFGENARLGSTIEIEGKQLPYRPVAAIYFRGSQAHRNSTFTCHSIELLNQIVGAADVPGGALGFTPTGFGHPDTGRPHFVPKAGPDGLLVPGIWMVAHLPYPPHEPTEPQSLGLGELFPFAMVSPLFFSSDQEEVWENVNLPYRPEMMINLGTNPIMSVGNAGTVANAMKKYKFIASFDLFLNEFNTGFADIVLPDASFLERLDPNPNHPPILHHPSGMGDWGWQIRQPVVRPIGQRRHATEVIIELAEEIGITRQLYMLINMYFNLEKPYALDPYGKYSWNEICDLILKFHFGDDRGLEWFKQNGVISWPKKVEEVYWRPFLKIRVPIYWEFVKRRGEQARRLSKEKGYKLEEKIDFSKYQPLPDWIPCVSHEVRSPEYDLFAFYYRDVLHTNSFTMESPLLDEVALMDPLTYRVAVNSEVGRQKGLKDDDEVWVESYKGRKVRGKVRLLEGLHPETLAIAACAGHWSDGMPIAKGKGIFFNELIEVDLEHADPINLNQDLCVKVKVYKA